LQHRYTVQRKKWKWKVNFNFNIRVSIWLYSNFLFHLFLSKTLFICMCLCVSLNLFFRFESIVLLTVCLCIVLMRLFLSFICLFVHLSMCFFFFRHADKKMSERLERLHMFQPHPCLLQLRLNYFDFATIRLSRGVEGKKSKYFYLGFVILMKFWISSLKILSTLNCNYLLISEVTFFKKMIRYHKRFTVLTALLRRYFFVEIKLYLEKSLRKCCEVMTGNNVQTKSLLIWECWLWDLWVFCKVNLKSFFLCENENILLNEMKSKREQKFVTRRKI